MNQAHPQKDNQWGAFFHIRVSIYFLACCRLSWHSAGGMQSIKPPPPDSYVQGIVIQKQCKFNHVIFVCGGIIVIAKRNVAEVRLWRYSNEYLGVQSYSMEKSAWETK
jgi:hypothetical protein